MKALLPILLFLFAFLNIALCQMSATLTVQDKQFLSESYKVGSDFLSYSSDVILLQSGIMDKAFLEFQFPLEEKIINHLNYKEYQLELTFNTSHELLYILPKIESKANKLHLTFETGNIEDFSKLEIFISDSNGNIVAQFFFPIEIVHSDKLAGGGGRVNNTPQEEKINFSEAPLFFKANTINSLGGFHRLDSNSVFPIVNGEQLQLTFVMELDSIHGGLHVNDLKIVTKWMEKDPALKKGKSVDNKKLYILPKDQKNKLETTLAFSPFIENSKVDSAMLIPPSKVILYDPSEIRHNYNLKVVIVNKKTYEKKTGIITFHFLK